MKVTRTILPPEFDFTQGNLQDYVDCAYRFYLRYIKRVKWPALVVDDAAEFEQRLQAGAHFHRLIQQYLVGIPEARISEMVAALSSSFSATSTDLATWWDRFLNHVPPMLDGQTYVETTLATSLAGQRLVAKYDLILLTTDHRLIIFDWKTSNKAPRVDWLLDRLQTKLYSFILAQLCTSSALSNFLGGQTKSNLSVEPEQITMNYWFVSQPATPVTLPYNQTAYRQDQEHLSRLVNHIRTAKPESFYRTSDLKQCRYCVYRSHCDRGIEAGNLSEFEDFDSDLDSLDTKISFEDIPEIKF